MNDPNLFDNSLMESLRQLTPNVPPEIKSRLLYECGIAAAETKMQKRRRKQLATTLVVLLVSMGAGILVGYRLSGPQQPMSPSKNCQVASKPAETPTPEPSRFFACDKSATILTTAMSFNRVFQLLDRTTTVTESSVPDLAISIEKPLSTLSSLSELD